jgi:glutamate racemase
VEEGWLNKRETKMILRRYLHPLRTRQIDTLVLGCTHYPLLSPLIQSRIGRRVQLIDSSIEVALHLKTFLKTHPHIADTLQRQDAPSHFFVSDSTEPVRQLADRIFGRTIPLEKVNV